MNKKLPTSTNTPETRARIRDIIDTLKPEIQPSGILIEIPYEGNTVQFPATYRTRKGVPDLAKEHIARLYQEQYNERMPVTGYRHVIREICTSAENIIIVTPPDLEIVTGTTDIFISRSTNCVYQRKGKSDTASYFPIFHTLPLVTISHTLNGDIGRSTYYDIEIDGYKSTVTSDDLKSLKWVDRYPSLKGIGNSFSIGVYAQVIHHLKDTTAIITNVTHTGVHTVETDNGLGYGYVTSSGQLITGNIAATEKLNLAQKVTGDTLALWEEYETVASQWDKKLAIDAVDFCMHLTEDTGIALISLCHHVRTLFRFVRNNKFRTGYLLYLFGPGGTGKTSIAILTSSVGKPYLYPDGIDATFRSTVTSIESKIDAVSDRPFIIDDLHKAPDDSRYEVQKREKILDAITRSAMDSSPIRERMNSNMTAQKVNTVKTFPTVTGEYFPVSMATSFMRRTLFVEVPANSIPRKARQSSTSLETGDKHIPGLYKLGRKVLVTILNEVNSTSLDNVANKLCKHYKQYYTELYDAVYSLWSEQGYDSLPEYADSIVDAAAHVMLGGRMIDHVTSNSLHVLDNVRDYLVKVVYSQLLIMSGMKRTDGLTPLDTAIQELFTSITEEKRIDNMLLVVEDYHQIHAAPSITIPLADDNTVTIPPGQWLGVNGHATNARTDKQVAAYIHVDKKICYLTSTGKDALLAVSSNTEGLETVKTPKALSQQLSREKWLVSGDKNNLTVPCNPQKNKAQIRCLPLSLERLLALVYDHTAMEDIEISDTTVVISPNTEDNQVSHQQVSSNGHKRTIDDILNIGI